MKLIPINIRKTSPIKYDFDVYLKLFLYTTTATARHFLLGVIWIN